MNIRKSAHISVIEAIQRPATEHGFVLYDSQGDTVYLPVWQSSGRRFATAGPRADSGDR
jgi:hypothetical protein